MGGKRPDRQKPTTDLLGAAVTYPRTLRIGADEADALCVSSKQTEHTRRNRVSLPC